MNERYGRNETLLLKFLGASPTLRIIDFFLDNPLLDYSKNGVAKDLAVSRVTFSNTGRNWRNPGLSSQREIGRATLCRLDRVPTPEELRSVLTHTDARGKSLITMLASSGMRV